MDVAGKVITVTGAGNGIGRHVVLALLSRGAEVAAVDLSPEGLAETAALAAAGERLSTHVTDVTDRAAVAALPAAVTSAHGRVDGVINVAGIMHRFATLGELDLAELDRVMGVNFWGAVHMSKAFLPLLRERPEAALVNVSSMGGLLAIPEQGAYGASKAALSHFTSTLRGELRTTGVRVSLVIPGGIDTGIMANSGVAPPNETAARRYALITKFMTSPTTCAEKIVRTVEKGSFRVRIGADARMADLFTRALPQGAVALTAAGIGKIMHG